MSKIHSDRFLLRNPAFWYESQVGHVTTAADHPHGISQVNAWLDAARAGSDSIPTCTTSKRERARRRRATRNTRQGNASNRFRNYGIAVGEVVEARLCFGAGE